MGLTFKQLCVIVSLQTHDMVAEILLGDKKPFGCFGKIHILCCFSKVVEAVGIHKILSNVSGQDVSVRPNLRDPIKHILRDLNKIMGILRKETFFVIGKDQPVVDQ